MRFDTLEAWLAWQESLNPRGIELGLDRVRRVLQRMDLAQPPFQIITIGGTNGKGSVASYAAAMLQADGLRTGRYLSPHILHYNERIAVDGTDAADDELCAAFEAVDRARGDASLTYFEFGTLAAFEIFRRRNVEVAVLEVGLGGRLDAVNVLDADVAVVVSIGLDHVDWLGEDVETIAHEKAGIFRKGRSAIFGAREMPQRIATEADRIGAHLQRYGEDFSAEIAPDSWTWRNEQGLVAALPHPPLRGQHQFANAATAIAAVLALRPEISRDAIRAGLANSRLPGRLQLLSGAPEVILDVGHNPDAAARVADYLRATPKPTSVVLAMLRDKEAAGFVRELAPQVQQWYFAGLEGDRGQTGEALAERLEIAGLHLASQVYTQLTAAASAALRETPSVGRVVVLGSFHTVAEFLVYFEANHATGGPV